MKWIEEYAIEHITKQTVVSTTLVNTDYGEEGPWVHVI